ncbi:MAG: type II secretion system protein N [Candidatus Thiodiazotropha taylori]
MSPWKTFFNLLTLLLLVVIGLASAMIFYQWRNPLEMDALENHQANPASKQTAKKASLTRFNPPSMTVYQEITDRPLFREGRVPPAEPEKEVSKPVVRQTPLKLRLEGVVITPKNRVAVIRDLNNNRLLRVAQGMSQNDWKLESVDHSSATVVRRGKKHNLELKVEKDQKIRPPKKGLPFRPSNK